MDARGSAVLADEIAEERTVVAVVPRAEVARALDEEAQAELLLRLVSGHEERGTVSVAWTKEALERLLGQTGGDEVVLAFDREQLEDALGDVEAHGLRERALLVAIVGAGALGGGAGVAAAMPTAGTGVHTSSAAMCKVEDFAMGRQILQRAAHPDQTAGGGFDLGGSGAIGGAIAGGLALTIGAAGFATRRAHSPRPAG